MCSTKIITQNCKCFSIDENILTWAGTATASFAGRFLGSRMTSSIYKADPESTLAKKTFQIVNQITLLHALFSMSLWAMYPWMEEKNSIIGGTAFRNNWSIKLGRYPVITSLTTVLQEDFMLQYFHQIINLNKIWTWRCKLIIKILVLKLYNLCSRSYSGTNHSSDNCKRGNFS